MKKTKLLTSIAALALVLGLGACEVNVDAGGVDVGVDVNPNDSSEDNTGENTSDDDSDITTGGDVCEHEWGEWVETTPASCTETGLETRTCSLCGEVETRTIDALGHDYQAVVTNPTCTEKGYTTYTCSRCNDTYTSDETDALGHDWVETSNTATCTEAGVLTETCTRCGEIQTTEIDVLGHDPQGEYHCDGEDADEYHYQYCSRCGEAIEEEHDLTGTATPADENYHKVTCALCGHEVKIGHDIIPDVYTDSGDGEHCYLVCETCGYHELHNHVWGNYESDGTNHWKSCTRCGAKGTETAHSFDAYEFDENSHWAICSECGASSGTTENHTLVATSDDHGHFTSCVCGYTTPYEEHDYEDITPVSVDGYKHAVKQCKTCGYQLEEVHQVATSNDTTCSICGAEGLTTEGITYTVSGETATAAYSISSDPGIADGAALFVPAAYVDQAGTSYPVTSIGSSTSRPSTNTLSNATRWYTYIGLPEGLTELGNSSLAGGQYNATKLKEFNVPSTVTKIGSYLTYVCQSLETISFEGDSQLTSIDNRFCYNCENLKSIELPDSVTSIGTGSAQNGFYGCTSLEYAYLGSVTEIPGSTFYNDTSLKEVVIPASCTTIGYQAFYNCTALETIYYGGTEEQWATPAASASSNDAFVNSMYQALSYTVLYYSETELAGGWHYVAGVPTAW